MTARFIAEYDQGATQRVENPFGSAGGFQRLVITSYAYNVYYVKSDNNIAIIRPSDRYISPADKILR